MTRLTLTLTAVVAAGLGSLSSPAAAQQGGRLEVVVYGNDPCPRSVESNIVVCVHKDEKDRYRLPRDQQLQGTRQQRESWAQRSQALTTAGATGAQSCSPVGPGGFTGCLTQEIRQNKQARKEQQEQDTPPER